MGGWGGEGVFLSDCRWERVWFGAGDEYGGGNILRAAGWPRHVSSR